jgi:hypothetical protein
MISSEWPGISGTDIYYQDGGSISSEWPHITRTGINCKDGMATYSSDQLIIFPSRVKFIYSSDHLMIFQVE